MRVFTPGQVIESLRDSRTVRVISRTDKTVLFSECGQTHRAALRHDLNGNEYCVIKRGGGRRNGALFNITVHAPA